MHVGRTLAEEGVKGLRVKDAVPSCHPGPRRLLMRRGHESAHHPTYAVARHSVTVIGRRAARGACWRLLADCTARLYPAVGPWPLCEGPVRLSTG
jgi:hypothetical protein